MYVTGDLATITIIRDSDNEERGLPLLCSPIGGGRHVDTDPLDPLSIGWSLERFPVEQSTADPDAYGFEIDDHFVAATAPRLTGLARARVEAATPARPPAFVGGRQVRVPPGQAKKL